MVKPVSMDLCRGPSCKLCWEKKNVISKKFNNEMQILRVYHPNTIYKIYFCWKCMQLPVVALALSNNFAYFFSVNHFARCKLLPMYSFFLVCWAIEFVYVCVYSKCTTIISFWNRNCEFLTFGSIIWWSVCDEDRQKIY